MQKELVRSDFKRRRIKKIGLVSSSKKPIKVLGKGDVKSKLNLAVTDFSKSAQQKIEAAGGTITKDIA
jgi:large subunit ribosomal protein L15